MDASDEFWDIGHSEQAMDDMKQYIIGKLSDEDCAALKEKASSGGAGGGSMLPILVLVLLVAACGAALCTHKCVKGNSTGFGIVCCKIKTGI